MEIKITKEELLATAATLKHTEDLSSYDNAAEKAAAKEELLATAATLKSDKTIASYDEAAEKAAEEENKQQGDNNNDQV